MNISLIICTYMRAESLLRLIGTIQLQTRHPDEVIIVDGSIDDETEKAILRKRTSKIHYYKVAPKDRGLTRQRNYGIKKVSSSSEVIAFLDDDTMLSPNYFEVMEQSFLNLEDVVGIGGVATNENRWQLKEAGKVYGSDFYQYHDYVIQESVRNKLRRLIGLESKDLPGIMPDFSHGNTYSYPLTGESHAVDLLIGMSMAFRTSIFEHLSFSNYFDGYGLYEDVDISLRARSLGKNYIVTNLQLEHHHAPGGRPNAFKYGKMVLRNGWFVWRLKSPKPSRKTRFKWHATTFVLTLIRFSNVITGPDRLTALKESLGRSMGWWSLLIYKPKIQ